MQGYIRVQEVTHHVMRPWRRRGRSSGGPTPLLWFAAVPWTLRRPDLTVHIAFLAWQRSVGIAVFISL